MEILSLDNIASYSRCPAYYYFSKESISVPDPKRIQIVRDVIQKCYLRHTQSSYRTEWRQITGWVNKAVFQDVDVFDDKQTTLAMSTSEGILLNLRNWYDKIYLKEEAIGYVDIKVGFNIGKYRIEEQIPIIRIDNDRPTLIYFSDVEIGARQLYNEFKYRAAAWLYSKQVEETRIISIEHLYFGPQGSFIPSTITLNKKDNSSVENRITHILYCIDKGINYPSITTMCNSCPFRSNCNI